MSVKKTMFVAMKGFLGLVDKAISMWCVRSWGRTVVIVVFYRPIAKYMGCITNAFNMVKDS